ncbi:M20/M25/M40 family metallo-hydrolase [Serratia sp. M24T3]|uniref:M20/M25/M40 family metallo-hydrolase n=1 Tax=Serratia sp. M24T3 TaxID=932213 RepID=UPI00025BAAB4|nr:M20/M25/M40 family metallo-hydrolase [Serratia sp. M24T3]EIC85289.1 peptidase M20 [Serratia sp. M24T3]
MSVIIPESLRPTLDLLSAITPFVSVAGELNQQQALAQWLEHWMVDHLGAVAVLPVSQQLLLDVPPLVHVRINNQASKTLVLYNMYDVMPADDQDWTFPPFRGGLQTDPLLGDVFIARGAENNKGPLAGMLMALKALCDNGNLTVNIELIIEGQEETGSGYLRRYLAQTPCPISPAEAVFFPSLCEYGGGEPRVYLGFSGLTAGELRVKGGAWGGPEAAIHASNASWIANPVWKLVQALNALAPSEANGVIERLPIDPEAQKLLTVLAATFSIEDELRFRRSQQLFVRGDTLSCLQQLINGAVLTLAEIRSDPLDARGVIPHSASAQLALRVAPGINGEKILQNIRETLSRPDLQGVELRLNDSYPGHRFAYDSPGVAELLNSYQLQGANPQVWPWAPGCAPAYTFAHIAPAFLIGGLGHGGNAHGVNEFVTLRGLARFQQSIADWIINFCQSSAISAPIPGSSTLNQK